MLYHARRFPLSGWIGAIIIVLLLSTAILSFFWTPADPVHAEPSQRLLTSSTEHWMGTDRFGRDVFSRVLVGARMSIFVGLIAVGISFLLGTPLGMWAGMKGGFIESLIMRGADLLLAFPALLMAIIATAIAGPSTTSTMTAIGIAGIPSFARVARSGTLQVMTQDYILAARQARRPSLEIAYQHVFPNILGLVMVQISVAFSLAILAEAALSFLGLGTPPPDPSWGRMLHDAQASMGSSPHLVFWPGLAIALSVCGFSLLGDGLRDLFDPRARRIRRSIQS
ncbi:ABC transporter permease subunit [Corynebacterium poyangense]|uniref:ABC transporter permease subunit n=1 Tax=Corynebacterium poyangense TaxID=2684405 RepID=A0A7H0SQ39_9CORY|nr:ABC transporter permease [Corynebacterium poyangense]MBZ8178400.1 ABC transporter permease subunit [Corynebacterium poyangense]QNQ90664.1 ABC transporter permease subunit [Corynebacterium poyangense]